MNPPPDAPRESRAGFWITLAAALGCFVIFLVVLYLAYLPGRRTAPEVDLASIPSQERSKYAPGGLIPAEEEWKYTPAGRQAHLDEMHARERKAQTTYAWIDQGKGVVQLPIDRAMELTLRDLNAARKP